MLRRRLLSTSNPIVPDTLLENFSAIEQCRYNGMGVANAQVLTAGRGLSPKK